MMNSKLTTRGTLVASAVIAISGLYATGAAAFSDSAYDEALALAGKFELGNGETKSIAHRKADERYRVCVHRSRHNVPLKVIHDNEEAVVSPGDCADFEAKDISVTPGGKLGKDTVLFGKFRYLR